MNKVIGTVILVIIVTGALLVMNKKESGREEAIIEESSEQREVDWSFEDMGENQETFAPETKVTLTYGDKTYDAGIYEGSCQETASSGWELLPGEISGVICWWAGAGSEIGIFQEGDSVVVKTGILEEPTAETEGLRGDFKELLVL